MDQPSTNKKRTPSRCREWEKQRRIKFNDAISKLGDIVKSIHKANSNLNGDDADNANYPKIEIVQKAIICLTNIIQEKTQLKAEILALEVKLEAIEKQKQNKKDVSLQVTIGLNKKSQNNKYMKLLMLQKSKENNGKEREKTTIIKSKPKIDKKIVNKSTPKLPKLLPLTNMKKENTIVMLPATPYIFPQRPMLFPQPPTIVLVDTNLQTLNKPTIPVINRNTNDITRTTMVNVLPISAYSHPLSALKSKKSSKARNGSPKKGGKKTKTNDVAIGNNMNEEKLSVKFNTEDNKKCSADQKDSNTETNIEISKESNSIDTSKEVINSKDTLITPCENNNKLATKETVDINKTSDPPKVVELLVSKPSSVKIPSPNLPCSSENVSKSLPESTNDAKCDKIPEDKTLTSEYKNKDSKLPPIIDPAICENVVDGGNARLELAEEFLAASPTAAFLMSFPLVSGNRADSPAEEASTTNTKDTNRRGEITQQVSYFDKSNTSENKTKSSIKPQVTAVTNINKAAEQQKYESNQKETEIKATAPISCVTTANDNPFLNLPLPSIISSSCNLADATFGIDFDCNVTKTGTITTTSHSNSNNFMYKSDPFNTVKSTIYSTSSIPSGHEFNSIGLYPCAMDNYSNKNKPDFTNVEDNLMKINSSRLTYDIDLGWSHKSLDFVNCTTSTNTFHKDTILNTVSTSFSTNYNPFNPDFHVPLVPNSNKKNPITKTTTFPDQITNFYSQSGNLWSDEVSSIYTNSNVTKNLISKQQNYFPAEHLQSNVNAKTSTAKQFETKHISESSVETNLKPAVVGQQIVEKYTKKSPSKMHINWMTSEIRPMQNNCNQTTAELKESKIPYSHVEQLPKKQTQNESNYFPINMHHFPTQSNHEEIQVWPTARPAGTTEISIDPPPINLPTLVGDLALGPHDKKKADILNRSGPHADLQNCGNFLSVTQLMNRSTENMPQRPNVPMVDQKTITAKQNLPHIVNDVNRKAMTSSQTNVGYGFNDSKILNTYENMNQFLQNKSKSALKPEKNSKAHKNNYSAEALIRGGTNYNQKLQDNASNKFIMPAQKYNDFNIQDTGVAQVSHFPPIIDYSDNSYPGQQFSGTALYNSTTNTISNSFYSNFMPGSSNLMSGNYTAAPFTSDFVDYNQTMECNYTNHKYNEVKMRNNTTVFQQDKETSNYKSSRRESAAKHKLECSKKDSTKKYQNKRPKLANEVEEWNDTSHLLWQNKTTSKRHQNLMSEDIPFPNYMGNQMPTQYQPDFFNSHIMPSNMQGVGNADRSLASFPVASRANFNLSALFPEITMKVQ